mmetsp:Transcript_26539/g.76396  ORF Transcript_26539/g.76396 Transcript_26539/m.76396 type:complete len:1133 (-) Transcript_26539:201-3599(-)
MAWWSSGKRQASGSLNGPNRTVPVLDKGDEAFCNNMVITSHYTAANFLPKNIIEQFSKPANCYFLFLSILQTLPRVTTTFHVPTILVPLVCIVIVNAIKDAIEDWRRHASDREENDRATLTMAGPNSGTFAKSTWADIRVGNMIVVKANEYVPADLAIVASAHDEGHVFIETANLDGETNLKTKQAPAALAATLGTHKDLDMASRSAASLRGNIECEHPNEFLYTFVGTLNATAGQEAQKTPLSEENVLLRGCKVKNVAWAIGIVVFTGRETKIMMNAKEMKGRKMSHLERDVGKFTVCIGLTQVFLCVIAAAVNAWYETTEKHLGKTYLNLTSSPGGSPDNAVLLFIISFFRMLILFSNFIPISLLVSMDFVKLIQVAFFFSDEEMVHMDIHCTPRTWNLNEEMGQIDYVFSDKTGTLTCNVMDFRKFCVKGVTYGEGMTEIRRNVMMKKGLAVKEPPKTTGGRQTPHVDLVDTSLEDILNTKRSKQYMDVREFLLHLAINHEVICELGQDGSLGYSASSPDESALCYGARHFGFTFQARDPKGITVQLDTGDVIKVRILAILKFNSTRKRSSVIAQFQDAAPGGQTRERLVIYTKGADSVVMARLRDQKSPETLKTFETLTELAEDGLRTLCLAGKDLSKAELDTFMKKFDEASCDTSNRQEKLDAVADEIEANLELHGITGIEDRLQDGVGETIVKMTQAGIKVWMLTGDKTETAINIGIATGLLEPEVKGERPLLTSSDFEVNGEFQKQDLVRQLAKIAERAEELTAKGGMFEGFVIDGKCLETALEPQIEKKFVQVARACKTVVCCRVTPKQKGAVVRLIKREEKCITLAIGDGANDCNMIQSADVGIGIRGLEGLQAFNVSDYGISQFRFLLSLLLVHGRWCYRRIAILVNYTFYKNLVLVLPQFLLGCVGGFSGQKLYNDLMYQLYNVIHSMLPIVLFAVLDQDVSRRTSLEHPELYSMGLQRAYLNPKYSLSWMFSGVWHALCVFFIPYWTMSNGNITHSDGKANDLWFVGTVVYLSVVLIVNLMILLETCYLSWFTAFGICFSFFFWFLEHGYLAGVHGPVVTTELYGTTQRLFGSPMMWLQLLTTVAFTLMFDLHVKGIRCACFPTVLNQVQGKVLAAKRAR